MPNGTRREHRAYYRFAETPVNGRPTIMELSMPKLLPCCLAFVAVIPAFCQIATADEHTDALLKTADKELRSARLSDKEIELRLKIIENVAALKAYYPHADGGRPEYRNPKYWKLNSDGSYVPRGSACEAVRDLWHSESGVRCSKLSALVLIKAMIDTANEKRLAELDEMLRDKVIPNELPNRGVGTLFTKPKPKNGETFATAELLAGDQVWFDNPYFDRLDRAEKRKYVGQEGHHVFYIGGGKVMDMYGREPLPVEEFRKTFFHWKSVRIVSERENRRPRADEFQIKAVRRAIVAEND
jgi:hypothetical protein